MPINIELKDDNFDNIKPGCIIITDKIQMFLVTRNNLDDPYKCSIPKGYVLIDMNSMEAWSIFVDIKDIYDCFKIVKIIQLEKILLKEV